nr:DUF6168 family protein [uncultured Psychroserpens sp.]
MIKKLIVYTLSFAILFAIIHFTQDAILGQTSQKIRFNNYDTNIFFALSSLIICIHFEIFSHIKALQPQLGFIYLPTLFIKGILFFILFKSSIFEAETLKTIERLNLLIPLLLFLALEVFFITLILKEKPVN